MKFLLYYYYYCFIILVYIFSIFIPTDCQLNQLDTFCINSKINSWINVAVMIDHLIFAGCNEGSIYLFKLNQQVYFSKMYLAIKIFNFTKN